MGKLIKADNDHKEFLHGLQQMYNGTKKWGTVRVCVKRSKYNSQLTLISVC